MATMKNTPLKTAKNGKITVNLFYDFIDELYTIKRKTKNTIIEERTKDRKYSTYLFYLFLNYSIKEIKTIDNNIINLKDFLKIK